MIENKISDEEKELMRRLQILEKNYKQGLFSSQEKLPILEEIDTGQKSNFTLKSEASVSSNSSLKKSKFEGFDNKINKIEEREEMNEIKEELKEIAKSKEVKYSNAKNLILTKQQKIEKKPIKDLSINNLSIKDLNKKSELKPEISLRRFKNVERTEEKKESKNMDSEMQEIENEIKRAADLIKKLKLEISKAIVGQERVINGLIRGLICNGHVLLEGVPGIAKTLTIRALGQASGCEVKRVQFTVDLLPTDIIGITSYTPQKGFEIIKGPVFANFLIADEINRSPPKTQSALIEAMQEKQVTIGKTDFQLPNPFFVMATKNPLESTGVYALPEAQMDRFLFNLIMEYPNEEEERKIMEDNATLNKFEDFNIKPVINPQDIVIMQKLVKRIYLSDYIKSYIIGIVKKTRDKDFKYADCIAYGASPRASIALFIASKSRALTEGRSFVIPEDVREVISDILRHRIILTYKATIKGVSIEDIIKSLLEEVKV